MQGRLAVGLSAFTLVWLLEWFGWVYGQVSNSPPTSCENQLALADISLRQARLVAADSITELQKLLTERTKERDEARAALPKGPPAKPEDKK